MWAFSLLSLLVISAVADDSIVQTAYGPVQGKVYTTYRKFEGIPYAAPPVDDLRFENPQPPKPWTEVLATQAWKAGCPQNCVLPPHTCPHDISEDCLYLNVYTPLTALTKTLPVMVWIHGGHFDQGAAGTLLYDGGNFVTKGDVVLVTLNYRLGALGWLVTEDLPGNFAFEDQLMALNWVKNNIKNFGGDPNQVTLFGQSAGGTSTRAHLTSPASKGLFNKVIIHSDPISLPMQSTRESQDLGAFFMKTIGCTNVTCIKQQPLGVLLEAQILAEKHITLSHPLTLFLPFTPTVDGKLIPHHVFDAINAGTWNNVPIMIGSTSQDALLFIYKAIKNKLTTVEYEAALTALFGSHVVAINKWYQPPIIGDKRPLFSAMGTDYIFTCPIRHELNLVHAKFPSTPTYLYQFNHSLSFDAWGVDYPFCNGKVCHGSEIPFEFDPPELKEFAHFTPEEKILSTQMINYFTNFAKNADPNVGNPVAVKWPAWTPSNLINMELATPNKINLGLQKAVCDFWDTLGYRFGW